MYIDVSLILDVFSLSWVHTLKSNLRYRWLLSSLVLFIQTGVFVHHGIAQIAVPAPALGLKPSPKLEKLTVQSRPQLAVDTGAFNSQIRALALSANGKFVFASTDSDIRIWNVDTGKLVHTVRGFQRGGSGVITGLSLIHI